MKKIIRNTNRKNYTVKNNKSLRTFQKKSSKSLSISKSLQFDIIILGGGIAGLHSAYEILKRSPNTKLLLIEKENILGGRIHSFKDKYMQVECGAGRFHTGQHRMMNLIRELGLLDKCIEIGNSDPLFYDIQTHSSIDNPSDVIILKLLKYSRNESKEFLQNTSILQFAEKVLSIEETNALKGSFGYYSELAIMNAHDAFELITKHLSPEHKFMVLKGGLSQIIENISKKVIEMGGMIRKNHQIVSITQNQSKQGVEKKLGVEFNISCLNNSHSYNFSKKKNYSLRTTNKINYYASKVISALPKQVLEKIDFFRPIYNDLKYIVCEPLCRIYSKFPVSKDGKIWFENISKFNTNNNLRMVIPINSHDGVIMTSYTDYKYARYWKHLYDKNGIDYVNKKLLSLMYESTGIDDIPIPIKTHVFYWPCGVGYWGVGANSQMISEKCIQPFGLDVELYICGEHFSEKNQQWIEGALETSSTVVSRIYKN
jgi:hypothetical protein